MHYISVAWLYPWLVSFMSQWLYNALHFCCQVVFMSLLHVSVTVQCNESPSCLSDCTMHYISVCQWLYSCSTSFSCLSDCIHESPSCLSDCTMHYISVARLYSWVSFMSQWLYNVLHFCCLVVFMVSLSDFVSQWLYNALHFCCLVVFMVSLLHVSVTVQCTTFLLLGCIHG